MKILQIILLVGMLFIGVISGNANAKNVDGIIAVVNETVITQKDLDERFMLMKRQMRLNLTPQQVKALYSRTLSALIDEELYRNYATEKNIYVYPQDMNMAISNIEKSNGMEKGSFNKMAGALNKTAKEQIKSNILWQKIIAKTIGKKVSIPMEEIDLLIENLLAQSQTVEREISHILLTPTAKEDEEKVQNKINSIYKQLQSGENFAVLAKTFSTDTNSAGNKGYLGWFATGEMSPVLEEVLEEMEVDSFSKPVHSPAGWHILKVDSIRKTQKVSSQPIEEINIWKVTADISSAEKEPLRKLKKAMKKVKQSEDITEIIKEFGNDINLTGSGTLGWVRTDSLSLETAAALQGVDPKTKSKLLITDGKLEIYFVKSKRHRMSEQFQKYRNRVKKRLTDNRVELMARKFLRDLRRKAYIDVRL